MKMETGMRKREEIIVHDYSVSFGVTWKDVIFLPFHRYSIYGFTFLVYASIAIAIFVMTFHPTGKHYDSIFFNVPTVIDLIFLSRTGLAILHRVLKEHRSRKIYPPEPILILLIDVITMVPVAPYCFLVNRFDWHNPIDYRIGYYYSYALKLPRVIRLFYLYNKCYNDMARHPRTIVIVAHAMISALLILSLSSLYYVVYYYSGTKQNWADAFKEMKRLNVTSYEPSAICFLFAGEFFYNDILTPMPYYSMYEMQLAFWAIMLGYFCHNAYLTAHLVAIYVQLMRFKHFFEWRLLKVGTFTQLLGFEQPLQDAINTYYRTIWVTRGGYVEQPEIVELFPLQLKTEIAMDLYFDAIRHAKIFYNLNESFKKELSMLFQTEIYIPGQLMFQKDKTKSKLVYLHSGIVEVMSNENRDSPVLSLSPGTILGEICCLLPYVCTADIRSSTTCVAHVLRHRALKVLLSRDVALATAMRQIIDNRVRYARNKLQRLRHLDLPISHIYWIKKRWRTLGGDDNPKPRKVLPPEPLTKYYCSRYLPLLVLSTYYELKVHSICIRGKCSFVMEQDSSFRKFLDLFSTSCVVLHFFITFHMIVFVGKISPNVFALLTLFDLIYVMDIYFQAITAVRIHMVFISKPMDILVYKCKHLKFLLDVFASVPYDYFALVMGASPYYVGLCRLPKYLKLIKVVDFFTTYEQLINLSTRTMKILKAMTIHALFILISASYLYMWTCYNNQCRSNGWLETFKAQSRKDFGQNLESSDFLISLIYSASIYLKMKIHHVQPPTVPELLTQFAIGLIGFYLLNMTIVQMSGAIALENYPRYLYMFNRSFFESVFQDRPELRHFRSRVNEYISLQWFYTSSMSFADVDTLMNHKSKFVRHKVTHDFTIQNLRNTELFSNMSDAFLKLIASASNLYIIPVGQTLQRPNSSAADLYIMLDGYCKVWSYAPEDEEKRNTFFYSQYDIFPVVGFFQAVNSFLYVETYTAVKVFSIPFHDFMQCVKTVPHDGRILTRAIQDHLDLHRNLIMRIVHLPLLHYPEPKENIVDLEMFDYDGAHVKDGGNQNLQWRRVKKYGLKSKIYDIFMATHDPHTGRYLFYEIFRSILIVVEMIMLYLSMHRFIRFNLAYKWINITLLIAHAIDLYVRAHVHYFTKEGIRVTTPKATFYYYLNHSFAIDLISALPYEEMQVFEVLRGRGIKNWMNVTFCLIVRPLMYYRPFCLLSIMRKTLGIQYHNIILGISHSLVFFICFSHAAAFALVLSCDLNDDWYWECPEDSWLHYVDNFKYWDENDLLFTRTYYEVIISHAVRSSRYLTIHDFILFFLLGIFICIMAIWYLASIIGYTAFSTKYLVNFQERRRRYNTLAARQQIPKILKNELLEHYKYMFKKTRTDSPRDILVSFYPHLREAMQLAMYAPTLKETNIFKAENNDLFRFIVPFITDQYYVMDAIILRCNDINNNVYVVKKGCVEIVIADRIEATLGPGGMFGCFKKVGICRSNINVVAKVHADLLVIDTVNFLSVTKSYNNIKQAMRKADLTNCEFFEPPDGPNLLSFTGKKVNVHRRCTIGNWYKYTFDDKNKYIIFYRYFTEMHLAPLVSIIALITMVTISGTDETAMYWLGVDFYFLIAMYMTCHIGLTDEESGLMITRVRQLTKVYLKSWKFYLDVLTLIPIYLFKDLIQYKHDGILLINKTLHIMNMFIYYNNYLRTRYLPNHMRFTFLMYMLLFFLNAICFLLCTTLIILQDRSLTSHEIASYYLYLANIFTTAGINPPVLDTFTTFLYMFVALVLSYILFVLINAGFSKLAVMIYYTDMEFRRSVITFKAYCQNEYVSKPIINQCWYYLMYLYSKHGGEQFPSLILKAPNYILEAHMKFLVGDLILGHRLFKHAHSDFLRQMIRHLKYEFIMPGFTIVEAGDKRKRMYFIAEGTVIAINPKQENRDYEILKRGESFGEMQAIKGHRFLVTYKALTPVQIFGIKTKEWIYLLQWFPATGKTIMGLSNLSTPQGVMIKRAG